MTYKFKAGDMVCGLPGGGYNYTGKNSICEVVEYEDDQLLVRIIEPRPNQDKSAIGDVCAVDQDFFELVLPETNREALSHCLRRD